MIELNKDQTMHIFGGYSRQHYFLYVTDEWKDMKNIESVVQAFVLGGILGSVFSSLPVLAVTTSIWLCMTYDGNWKHLESDAWYLVTESRYSIHYEKL